MKTEISGGQVEYRITSSIASNPSGTGRADIVYFNTVIIPSVEYPDKEIVYHVYENGLINYYIKEKNTRKTSYIIRKSKRTGKGLFWFREDRNFCIWKCTFFRCSSSFCVIAFTGKKRDNSCSMN